MIKDESSKGIFESFFKLSSHILNLINLETKLAKKSLPWIIGIFLSMVVVLVSFWMIVLAILFCLFLMWGFSLLTVLWIVLLINAIILLSLNSILKHLNKNLRFSATGRQFKRIVHSYAEAEKEN